MTSKSPSKKDAKDIPPPDISAAHTSMLSYIRGPHSQQTEDILDNIQKVSGLDRDQLSYVWCVLIAAYLIFGNLASTLCNIIGFAYPAYVSVKAIRTEGKDDDTKWLIYWTVFGFFSVIDTFAEVILQYIPFYYLAKALFLLFLYLPQTNGAEFCYVNYVDPFVTKLDDWICGGCSGGENNTLKAVAAAEAEGPKVVGGSSPGQASVVPTVNIPLTLTPPKGSTDSKME